MEEISFEKALEKLEETVLKLEDSRLDLDKALKLFEEGVKLSRQCTGSLERARHRVEQVLSVTGEEGSTGDDLAGSEGAVDTVQFTFAPYPADGAPDPADR